MIGCSDIFKEVSGKGNSEVTKCGNRSDGGLSSENECLELNKRFFTFHEQFRAIHNFEMGPMSINGQIGSSQQRILISNDYVNRIVHKWRSEEAAILVGTNTAIQDNPLLTTRLWGGSNPTRIVIDKDLRVPRTSEMFSMQMLKRYYL